MRKLGLVLLAVATVAGPAACTSSGIGGGGDGSTSVTVSLQVRGRNPNGVPDDSFTIAIDGAPLAQTPYLAQGTTVALVVDEGPHLLRLTYSAATDNDNVGSYAVNLLQGLIFEDGSVAKTGDIAGLGSFHQFVVVTR